MNAARLDKQERIERGRKQAMAAEGKIDIGRVLSRGIAAFTANLLAFSAVALLLGGLPALALHFALPNAELEGGLGAEIWRNVALVLVVTMVVGNFATAVLVRSTILYLNGSQPDLGGSVVTALRLTVPMVMLSILVTIVITFGLILLIVPGIIFALALFVAVPVLVAEQPGVIDSMHRSTELTSGPKGQILLLFLVYLVASFGLASGLAALAGTDYLYGGVSPATAAVETLAGAASTLILSVMTASVYVELRTVKEGSTVERLAQVFA